jgi:lysophospholipase L1-like esterase
MKRIMIIIAGFLLITACASNGSRNTADKENSATYVFEGNIPVVKESETEWIKRYEDYIMTLVEKSDADTEKDIDVLFFGSSSIRLWKDLDEMMSPLKVVNRGYGGASIRDIHYNYDRVLADYNPKAFVIFCDNDICGNENDLTVGEVYDHYRLLFQRLEKDYPGIPVFFLSWKYSELTAGLRDKQQLVIGVMKDFAAKSTQVTFADVNSTLLKEDGDVNPKLFEGDNLHINRDGYLLWTSVLKPQLIEVCR